MVTWINYSISIIFLGLLSIRFISWYSIRGSKLLIAYALAMILLCINNALTIVDISYELLGGRAPDYIRASKSSVSTIYLASNVFNLAYFITSVMSFVVTWFATVLLLRHYSTKIGRAKYWIIVSIPLVYFLSQFQTILLGIFTPFRLSDPILFGLTYTLVFSASKPLGGILFGVRSGLFLEALAMAK